MASSETDIVNTALILLGEPTILALTDDLDVARAANTIWTDVRDDVLGEHPWNGCIKHVALSRVAADPIEFYTYAYLYPSDCIRILALDTDWWKWEIGTNGMEKLVWSNQLNPTVRYIARITNVQLYSSWLCLALAKRMAAELALTLTDHRGKAQDFYQAYEMQLMKSKMRDGQEQSPVVLESTALTTDVRLGGC